MKLLLMSNGFFGGLGYLEYAYDAVREHFDTARKPKTLLFVPYARREHDDYVAMVGEALAPLGIKLISAHTQKSPASLLDRVDGILVAGGNTFRLLDTIRKNGLLAAMPDKVRAGMPYLGVSAGTNIAAPTIRTTNDMPIVWPESDEAMGLVSFQINPHFVPGKAHYEEDGVPVSHNGETREQKIAEYHQENDRPVLALWEGTGLWIRGARVEMVGRKPARLFLKDRDPVDLGNPDIASAFAPLLA